MPDTQDSKPSDAGGAEILAPKENEALPTESGASRGEDKPRGKGGFGCLAGIVSVFAICAAFAAFALYSCNPLPSMQNSAKTLADATTNSAKTLADAAVKILTQKPEDKVVFKVRFLNASEADKYIVAQLREKFSTSKKSVKWKTFSSQVEYESEPIYKYYVPLSDFKIKTAKNADSGKTDIELLFAQLQLDTPVGEENRSIKVNQSKFSDDVNKSLDNFISNEIPKQIEDNGRDYYRILAATREARFALEKWAKDTLLPLLNIPVDIVGKVSVRFGQNAESEKPDSGVILLDKNVFESKENTDGRR